MDFKKYTGTKTVMAVPMTKTDAEEFLGRTIKPATPGEDGYLVKYPDGYCSWSPAKAFEEAYRISETHIDRMKIELEELNERICKATKTINTFEALPEDERWYLIKQLEAMNEYAARLYERLRHFSEPKVAFSDSPNPLALTEKRDDNGTVV